MDKVIVVYLGYAWVGAIHSTFAGICLYTIWGKKLENKHKILPLAILFCFLAFLEVYWMPIMKYWGVEIYTTSKELQQHFGIEATTNIAQTLRPSIMAVVVWLLQTLAAYKIGRYFYYRNKVSQLKS